MRTNRLILGQAGFKRLWQASRYSLNGLQAAYRNEPAFREEVLASLVFIPLALYLGDTGMERAILGRRLDAGIDRRVAQFRHRSSC